MFNIGDLIYFGKYKNKKGKIVGFSQDKYGNPLVEIEPIPKGKKQNKVFGLFRIWKAELKDNYVKPDEDDAKEKAGIKEASAYRTWAPYVPKTADLNPPLGDPGGPCHVVKRIVDRVKNPAQKAELIEDVENGESLSNPDASKVYKIETEQGAGLIGKILITAHGQYRMDLRGVTVDDVRAALASFSRQLLLWQQQGSKAFTYHAKLLEGREPVTWVDPRSRLEVVFQMVSDDTVKLVTTYWKGRRDPGPPGNCSI